MLFSSSACLLLLVELSESPGQAFRRHFGKHEHPVYFSRIRRGGGSGGVFVCPCERGGGGEKGEEGWIERKREVCWRQRKTMQQCESGGVIVGERDVNSESISIEKRHRRDTDSGAEMETHRY